MFRPGTEYWPCLPMKPALSKVHTRVSLLPFLVLRPNLVLQFDLCGGHRIFFIEANEVSEVLVMRVVYKTSF